MSIKARHACTKGIATDQSRCQLASGQGRAAQGRADELLQMERVLPDELLQ